MLTSKVLDSVKLLSDESNHILVFIDGTVIQDYNRLTELAQNYKQDAGYYAQVGSQLGVGTKEVSESIENINAILDTINEAQRELSRAMANVNENLQQITGTSELVNGETARVLESIESMQGTMSSFRV